MRPRAWVFNLRADEELAGGVSASHPPTPHEQHWREVLAGSLCAPGDVVLPGALEDPSRYLGAAWCPTPAALRILKEAGVEVPSAPALKVLRQVNDRAFALPLVPEQWRGVLVEDESAVEAALARLQGGPWVMKTRFGFAGRGQRRGRGAPLDENTRGWMRRRLARGGLVVEPERVILAEYARHGYLEPDGAVRWGRPVRQECDAQGAWVSTRAAAVELSAPEQADWAALLEQVARRLHRATYFGPFGVDAYRTSAGLHPLSDLNARYTMGYAVGMGAAP